MTDDFDDAFSKAKKIKESLIIKANDSPKPKLQKKFSTVKKKEATPAKLKTQLPSKIDATYDVMKREEDIDVDSPAHIILSKFREGLIDQADLSSDDKLVLIRHMREDEGMTPDNICQELGISRRTVFGYLNKAKQLKAQALADTDIWEIGGELYSAGMKAMEEAVRNKKYKEFAYLMTSLVSTLQSMGLIFKMPKQSQIQQNIVQDITSRKGAEGFKQLKRMSDSSEVNIDSVLTELLAAVKSGTLDKE
jgi:hypothetical protein